MKRHIRKTLEEELLVILQDKKASVFARLDAARLLCGLGGIVVTETVIEKDKAVASSKLAIQWKSAKHDIINKTLKIQEKRRTQNKRYRLRKKIAELKAQGQHDVTELADLENKLRDISQSEKLPAEASGNDIKQPKPALTGDEKFNDPDYPTDFERYPPEDYEIFKLTDCKTEEDRKRRLEDITTIRRVLASMRQKQKPDLLANDI